MNKKAFTLIELLVVVSIIALLVSILLPALSKAREQSKNVVCMTNLHQIGLASAIYAAESPRNTYPDYLTLGGSSFRVAPGKVSPRGTLPEVYGLSAVYADQDIIPGDSDVWVCPLNKRDREYGNTYFTNIGPITQKAEGYTQGAPYFWVYDNNCAQPYTSGVVRVQNPNNISNMPFLAKHYYHRGKTSRWLSTDMKKTGWGTNALHLDLSAGFYAFDQEQFPDGF